MVSARRPLPPRWCRPPPPTAEHPPDKRPSPHLPAPSAGRLPGLFFLFRRLGLSVYSLFVGGKGPPRLAREGPASSRSAAKRRSRHPPPKPPILSRVFPIARSRTDPSNKKQLTHGIMFLKKIIISLYYINYEQNSFPDVHPASPSAPAAHGRSAFQTTAGRDTNAGHFPFPPAPSRRATPWLFPLFFS